jgi:ABC-type transport system involved in cytochrome c biogenesis permease subunit
MPLGFLILTTVTIIGAIQSIRWWRRLDKLPYQELEKKLLGYENSHLLPQQRMAAIDSAKSRLVLLPAFLVILSFVLAWKTLQAFIL